MDLTVQSVKQETVAVRGAGRGLLARWHLLSLDAPTVATTWTWFAARTFHVALPLAIPAAMYVAVWLLYAGDRLLDGLRMDEMEERHWFHHRHRRPFTIGMVVAGVLLVPLAGKIPSHVMELYLALGGALAVWFGLVHGLSRVRPIHLLKELMPGVFCAAAAFVPVWTTVGFFHSETGLAATLYGLLIALNCCCIHRWEHAFEDAARGLRRAGSALMVVALLGMIWVDGAGSSFLLAVALSAGLLMTLDRMRHSFGRTDLRAASDLVLLTPWLVVALSR